MYFFCLNMFLTRTLIDPKLLRKLSRRHVSCDTYIAETLPSYIFLHGFFCKQSPRLAFLLPCRKKISIFKGLLVAAAVVVPSTVDLRKNLDYLGGAGIRNKVEKTQGSLINQNTFINEGAIFMVQKDFLKPVHRFLTKANYLML